MTQPIVRFFIAVGLATLALAGLSIIAYALCSEPTHECAAYSWGVVPLISFGLPSAFIAALLYLIRREPGAGYAVGEGRPSVMATKYLPALLLFAGTSSLLRAIEQIGKRSHQFASFGGAVVGMAFTNLPELLAVWLAFSLHRKNHRAAQASLALAPVMLIIHRNYHADSSWPTVLYLAEIPALIGIILLSILIWRGRGTASR